MEPHAAQAPALRERNHNFRHFRSFLILAHFLMRFSAQETAWDQTVVFSLA
jgi:hypothetical protein